MPFSESLKSVGSLGRACVVPTKALTRSTYRMIDICYQECLCVCATATRVGGIIMMAHRIPYTDGSRIFLLMKLQPWSDIVIHKFRKDSTWMSIKYYIHICTHVLGWQNNRRKKNIRKVAVRQPDTEAVVVSRERVGIHADSRHTPNTDMAFNFFGKMKWYAYARAMSTFGLCTNLDRKSVPRLTHCDHFSIARARISRYLCCRGVRWMFACQRDRQTKLYTLKSVLKWLSVFFSNVTSKP